MKKLVALLLAGAMVFSFAACGEKDNSGENNANNESNKEENKVDVKDATELLGKVWEAYGENDKFMAMGGDGETFVDGAPGKWDHTKAEDNGMESRLCFPAASVADIDDAAALMHGMMVNNFTLAGYHVTDASKVQGIVDGIKETTLNNQWMCGFPEKLLVITVGDDYVMSVFGLGEFLDVFETKVTEVYGDAAKVVVEESLAE